MIQGHDLSNAAVAAFLDDMAMGIVDGDTYVLSVEHAKNGAAEGPVEVTVEVTFVTEDKELIDGSPIQTHDE